MHWRYLKYVLRHKFFVYREGRKLGVGRWQLLVHDWSKFLPCEWLPYARFFYGNYPSRDDVHGDARNMVPRVKEEVKADFRAAWLHHQHANPHHWQHWVLREDDGDTKVLPIPDRFRREMLADWRGAGLALGFSDTAGWYRRQSQILHPETRAWIEQQLGIARQGDK